MEVAFSPHCLVLVCSPVVKIFLGTLYHQKLNINEVRHRKDPFHAYLFNGAPFVLLILKVIVNSLCFVQLLTGFGKSFSLFRTEMILYLQNYHKVFEKGLSHANSPLALKNVEFYGGVLFLAYYGQYGWREHSKSFRKNRLARRNCGN